MTDDIFERLRLRNGMTVTEATRHLTALHFVKEALNSVERELLSIAEQLLELVRQGAAIYLDSAAIAADLYETADLGAPGETGPRHSDALRTCDRAALQAIFDRYGITDVQIFGSVAKGTDQPGSDLDLLIRTPEHFSGFTAVDLADDLGALLGVPVDLVSNHPDNRGATMDRIRASAIPLSRVIIPSISEPAHSPAVRRAHDYRQRRLGAGHQRLGRHRSPSRQLPRAYRGAVRTRLGRRVHRPLADRSERVPAPAIEPGGSLSYRR